MSLSRPISLSRRSLMALTAAALLAACGNKPDRRVDRSGLNPGETPEMRALIRKYAEVHDIPESLIHRVVQRESDYDPAARNGPYYGLMQILPQTARTMGYTGKSRIQPREQQADEHFVPIEDRWRIGLPEWDRYDHGCFGV